MNEIKKSMLSPEELDNVTEFLDFFSPQNDQWQKREGWIFRGQAFDKPLIPKALREEPPDNEIVKIMEKVREYLHESAKWKEYEENFNAEYRSVLQVGAEFDLLRDFAKAADWQGQQLIGYDMEFRNKFLLYNSRDKFINKNEDYKKWPQNQYLELLALAQHSGLPTRLLDWSERAYFAAYFAACEAANPDFKNDLESDSLVVWALNTEMLENQKDKIKIKVIRPTMGTNPCLAAQRGVLTLINQHDEKDIERYICNSKVDNIEKFFKKVSLDRKYARELLLALYREGIHAGFMFPTLEGAVRWAIERRLWPEK